jgi:hypothetical protein
MKDQLTPAQIWTARAIAIAADALQIGLLPFFVPGAASPFDDVLDVIVAIMLWQLVGWHWAFLPSFAAELIPGLDLVPSWTAAVWFATRHLPAGEAPAQQAPRPNEPPTIEGEGRWK